MKDTKYFVLDCIDDNTKKNVSDLNEILDKVGVSLEYESINSETTESREYHFLKINYDIDIIDKKIKRNAGRKNIYAENIFTEKNVTYGEIREMQKTMKNEEIIEKLQISKATFYRKLKYHKEWNDDDMLF